jgi:hypothetical protein
MQIQIQLGDSHSLTLRINTNTASLPAQPFAMLCTALLTRAFQRRSLYRTYVHSPFEGSICIVAREDYTKFYD